MLFPIQFNNVSAYNITSPLIKKPEKDLGIMWGGRFVKLCVSLSTKILILYCRVNG